MNTDTTDELFRDAMARFTSGITAVTTSENGVQSGLIATSVCSLSSDPPTVLVCVNRTASAHDAILRSRVFAVNLLSARQKDIAQRFASAKGAERFDPARWKAGKTGAPILIDSVVSLDCDVIATHNGYSHTIFVGRIIASALHADPETNCLLWHQRQYVSAASGAR